MITDTSKRNYLFPEDQQLNADSVEKWIHEVLEGIVSHHVHVRSEAPPADNTGPVKIIVASTFDEIVTKNSVSVLVAFIAPCMCRPLSLLCANVLSQGAGTARSWIPS